MMRVHYFEHAPFETPAAILPWLDSRGCAVSRTRLYTDETPPRTEAFDALIVMGGPMSVGDEDRHPWLRAEKRAIAQAVAENKIVLGVCLGAQLLANVLGARVRPHHHKEIGWHDVTVTDAGQEHALTRGLPRSFPSFHWHSDTFDVPPGAVHLARTAACENQWFAVGTRVAGIQFHPEMTEAAMDGMLRACAADLTPGDFVQSATQIRGEKAGLHASTAILDCMLTALTESD